MRFYSSSRIASLAACLSFLVFAGCSDELISEEQPDDNSALNEEDVQQANRYDFSTPEEYVLEYVKLYKERSANYSSDSCTEVPGRFSEGFKSELESLTTIVLDPSISDEERIGYAEDLNSIRESICAPDVFGSNFTLIVEELMSSFPYLSNLDDEGWRALVDNALAGVAAKTTDCEEKCNNHYVLETLSLAGKALAAHAGCAALTGPLAPACIVGVGIWHLADQLILENDLDDCLAACLEQDPPA
ncbi:MAG: hypothetical protein OXH03_02180 [Bacteroidetes bacterium]|nr:hypothetical protein [Bacteroidota bacterium]MDE2672193.1 hypothetical protein [Bacteroidota bacterium]